MPNIDFDFVRSLEGGQLLDGYVPEVGKSGVTIASGFDLGQWAEGDVRVLFKEHPALVAKLMPYMGLKRDVAEVKLAKLPLHLSKEEADLVDKTLHEWFVSRIVNNYDGNYMRGKFPGTARKFNDLPAAVQTVWFSVVWNLGFDYKKKYPHAYDFYHRNDWERLGKELMNFKHRSNGLNLRRREEGKYLAEGLGLPALG